MSAQKRADGELCFGPGADGLHCSLKVGHAGPHLVDAHGGPGEGQGLDLTGAVEAVGRYLASGQDPSITERALARGAVRAAAPEVLRAAADQIDDLATHDGRDLDDAELYCDGIRTAANQLRALADGIGGQG